MTLQQLRHSIGQEMVRIGLILTSENQQPQDNEPRKKYTRRVKDVLRLAHEETERLHQDAVGVEHLLLGLVRERDGVAGQVLIALGADPEKIRQTLPIGSQPETHVTAPEKALTPQSKKVVEFAVEEARQLDHHYIGTEHILLGLIRELDDEHSTLLQQAGLNSQQVRAQTLRLVQHSEV